MMKKINWLFIVAGTFMMLYIMVRTGKPLETAATPWGILNLEFAFNVANANAVIKTWALQQTGNISHVKIAIQNTWLDFIFLFFYALFLFYSCKTIAESFEGPLQTMGKFLAMGALNAGLLDIAENAGMLLMLNGFSSNGIALLTSICSFIKWMLALSALLYVLIFGPLYLLKKYK